MVTVIAQFTAKMTKSEKTIYFLSLMSCSINKLKSVFRFLREKKNFFAPGSGGDGGRKGGGGLAHPMLSLRPCNVYRYVIVSCWGR